jgi:murein DD-endopeptidase MepM/ murein hydrolase activator NlpD
VVALAALTLMLSVGPWHPAAATAAPHRSTAVGEGRPTYRPPTTAAVLDPFRPPPQPWLSGNRGIEYATRPGDVVRAIGPGRVAFAGPVAGRLVATVVHPGGLRSSYTALGSLSVRRGDRLVGGAEVGRAGGPVHLGVRRGDRYLDPASLWGMAVGGGRVVLVPHRRHPGRGPDDGRPPRRSAGLGG